MLEEIAIMVVGITLGAFIATVFHYIAAPYFVRRYQRGINIDKILTNDVPHAIAPIIADMKGWVDHRIHTAKDEAIATLLTLPDQPIFHQVINEFGDVLETKLQKVLAEQGAKAAGAVLGQLSGQSKNLSKAAQSVMPPQMQILDQIMKQVPKQYQGLAAQFIANNPAIQNLINQAAGGAQNSPSGAPLGGGVI